MLEYKILTNIQYRIRWKKEYYAELNMTHACFFSQCLTIFKQMVRGMFVSSRCEEQKCYHCGRTLYRRKISQSV